MIRCLLTDGASAGDLSSRLHPLEQELARRFRHAGRRRQFVLGRFTAHQLLAGSRHQLLPDVGSSGDIAIDRAEQGWPQPRDALGRELPLSLSISHTSDWILAAACHRRSGQVGVDLESLERRSPAFMSDYFTTQEQDRFFQVAEERRHDQATLLWCIKEAALKALHTGLNLDARKVEVTGLGQTEYRGWFPATLELPDGARASAGWRFERNPGLALAMVWIPDDTLDVGLVDWYPELWRS